MVNVYISKMKTLGRLSCRDFLTRHLCLVNLNTSTLTQLHAQPADNVEKKIDKYESFLHRAIFREFDKNILNFPSLETKKLETKQYNHIRKSFTKNLCNSHRLSQEGYYDVHSMSNLELCHVFEAIGSSFYWSEAVQKFGQTENTDYSKAYVQTIIELLNHNVLVQPILSQSHNQHLNKKIAFCFCETNEKFASLPYPFWTSTATREEDNWRINGFKSQLLKADYDQFIVFCKTKIDNSKDFGVSSFLLDKDEVVINADGQDTLGNEYVQIKFNNLLRSTTEHEILTELDPAGPLRTLNLIGKGHLMTSAIILGLIKENVRKATQRASQVPDGLTKTKLVHATRLVYTLESMIYLNAHQFDLFNTNQFDIYLDSMAIKVHAFRCFDEIFKLLSLHLDAHRQEGKSVVDVVGLLDSYLTSSTSNTLMLSTYALRHFGAWHFDHIAKRRLPQIHMKHYLKTAWSTSYDRKVLQRYPNSWEEIESIGQTLPPQLAKSIKCLQENLEIILAMERDILLIYGKNCLDNQIDMSRLSNILLSAHQMAAVISRANAAIAGGGKFAAEQVLLCEKTCKAELSNAQFNRRLIEGVLEVSEERRTHTIHKRNMQYNGYFAFPVFDRVY